MSLPGKLQDKMFTFSISKGKLITIFYRGTFEPESIIVTYTYDTLNRVKKVWPAEPEPPKVPSLDFPEGAKPIAELATAEATFLKNFDLGGGK